MRFRLPHRRRLIAFEASLLVPFALIAGLAAIAESERADVIAIGRFSHLRESGTLPPEWQALTFKRVARQTAYTLAKEDGVVAIQARSHAAASALGRERPLDPQSYPVIRWRWKTAGVMSGVDPTRRNGDDYPLRLFILFGVDLRQGLSLERAGEALCYVWASTASQPVILSSPYTDRVKIIAVRRGTVNVNRWMTEERNVVEDYVAAFGRKPGRISGVAIMTDTDNTRQSVTAYYGDMEFGKLATVP